KCEGGFSGARSGKICDGSRYNVHCHGILDRVERLRVEGEVCRDRDYVISVGQGADELVVSHERRKSGLTQVMSKRLRGPAIDLICHTSNPGWLSKVRVGVEGGAK